MGLAPKEGVASAPLEAVDNLAPRSTCIPACLWRVDEAAPVAVAESAVARGCVDIEAVPVPPRCAAGCMPARRPSWSIIRLR